MDNARHRTKTAFDSSGQALFPVTMRSMDAWSHHDWTEGVQINSLQMLDRIFVHTSNSLYEFTVISPSSGEVLVRGGKFFPQPTSVRLAGSSFGGSFLKLLGIHVGFRMELVEQNRTIVTGFVRMISTAESLNCPE